MKTDLRPAGAFQRTALGPEIKARTIVVNGVSKAYAMTGWRIVVRLPPQRYRLMNSVQSHATSSANAIARKPPQQLYGDRRTALRNEGGLCAPRTIWRLSNGSALTCRTAGAFYLFVDISPLFGRTYREQVITGSVDFAAQLLEHAQVAVVPGTALAPRHCVFPTPCI